MTRILDVAEAQAQLPELIERAAGGELRVPGKGKNRFRVKKGFDAPLPERVLRLFEE